VIDERVETIQNAAADPLRLFSPAVAGWFGATFGLPTPPQTRGWPVLIPTLAPSR